MDSDDTLTKHVFDSDQMVNDKVDRTSPSRVSKPHIIIGLTNICMVIAAPQAFLMFMNSAWTCSVILFTLNNCGKQPLLFLPFQRFPRRLYPLQLVLSQPCHLLELYWPFLTSARDCFRLISDWMSHRNVSLRRALKLVLTGLNIPSLIEGYSRCTVIQWSCLSSSLALFALLLEVQLN